MIFNRFKKAVKKEKVPPSTEVNPRIITAEGWKRMHDKRKPLKARVTKKARS